MSTTEKFLIACEKLDITEARFLALKHKKIAQEARTPDGNSGLHIVCAKQHAGLIDCFLQFNDFDGTARNKAGRTPFDLVDDTLKLLFGVRSYTTPTSYSFDTVLTDISYEDLTLRFENGFAALEHERGFGIVTRMAMKMNQLYRAGQKEEADRVQEKLTDLYQTVIVPHYKDKAFDATGHSLQYWMAATNQVEALHTADINPEDPLPLDIACLCGNKKIVELLSKIRGNYTLACASISGDVELVQLLLEKWVNREFALHHACLLENNLEMVTLLAKNVELNEQFQSKETALMIACREGRSEYVKALCEADAQSDIRTSDKDKTALHFACESGNIECVRELLEMPEVQLNANMKSAPYGATPLTIVWDRPGHADIVQLLLEQPSIEIPRTLNPTMELEKIRLLLEKDWPEKDEPIEQLSIRLRVIEDSPKKTEILEFFLKRACEEGWDEVVKLLLPVMTHPKKIEALRTAVFAKQPHKNPSGLQKTVAFLLDENLETNRTTLRRWIIDDRHNCVRTPIAEYLKHYTPEGPPPMQSDAKPEMDLSEESLRSPSPSRVATSEPIHMRNVDDLAHQYSLEMRKARYRGDTETADQRALSLRNLYHDVVVPFHCTDNSSSWSSPLFYASATGQLQEVWREYEKGDLPEGALSVACKNGHLDVVNFLLPLSVPSERALINACSSGHLDIVKLLLAGHGNINKGEALYVRAVHENSPQIVRLLLETCTVTPKIAWVLERAALAGRVEVVRVLLSQTKFEISLETKDKVLVEVARRANLRQTSSPHLGAVITLLLEHGAGNNRHVLRELVQQPDRSRPQLVRGLDSDNPTRPILQAQLHKLTGYTLAAEPLFAAFKDFQITIFEHRAEPDYLQRFFNDVILLEAENYYHAQESPFYWAAGMGLLEAVKQEFPTEPHPVELTTALNIACRMGHLDVVRYLLDQQAVPSADSLAIACERGHLDVVELLLTQKAPTEGALYQACAAGHENIVARLLQEKVDLEETVNGQTALWIACEKGHVKIAKALLDAGANVNYQDTKYGFTPLMIACEKGDGDFVTLILSYKPNHALTSICKDTLDDDRARSARHKFAAIHVATARGFGGVVELLLKACPESIQYSAKDKRTPLAVAIGHRKAAIVETFIPLDPDADGIALWTACNEKDAALVERFVQRYEKNPTHFDVALREAVLQNSSEVVTALFSNPNLSFSEEALNNATRFAPVARERQKRGHVVAAEQTPVVAAGRPPVVPDRQPPVVTAERPPVVPDRQPPVVTAERPPVVPDRQPPVVTAERPPVVPDRQPPVVVPDFTAGTKFLGEVRSHIASYLKTKVFTRSKLKHKLTGFILDQLAITPDNTAHWEAKGYTEANLLKHPVDITNFKNRNDLSPAERALLVGKTRITLEEALDFRRFKKGHTYSHEFFCPTVKPVTPKDSVLQYLKDLKIRLLNERVKTSRELNTALKLAELDALIETVEQAPNDSNLKTLCECRQDLPTSQGKNLLYVMMTHREPQDERLLFDLSKETFKTMKKPQSYRDLAKKLGLEKELGLDEIVGIIKDGVQKTHLNMDF